ncbi:hypothetical protein LUX39_40005 [Actinomadura madurae]|nr:hypothetical protein [Actinomadura madurae]MCQ0019210.1 hypothetical protein [Actinomadura madurae]
MLGGSACGAMPGPVAGTPAAAGVRPRTETLPSRGPRGGVQFNETGFPAAPSESSRTSVRPRARQASSPGAEGVIGDVTPWPVSRTASPVDGSSAARANTGQPASRTRVPWTTSTSSRAVPLTPAIAWTPGATGSAVPPPAGSVGSRRSVEGTFTLIATVPGCTGSPTRPAAGALAFTATSTRCVPVGVVHRKGSSAPMSADADGPAPGMPTTASAVATAAVAASEARRRPYCNMSTSNRRRGRIRALGANAALGERQVAVITGA